MCVYANFYMHLYIQHIFLLVLAAAMGNSKKSLHHCSAVKLGVHLQVNSSSKWFGLLQQTESLMNQDFPLSSWINT